MMNNTRTADVTTPFPREGFGDGVEGNKFVFCISDDIRERCPDYTGAAVVASVRNTECCEELWTEIAHFIEEYRSRYTTDSIKLMPSIEATREMYKRCGKDPSRYRPSGEALVRRTLKGNDLYRVSTVVDLINLASIAYGYSISGLDADKIQGDVLTLGIGQEGEPYEGIGRGPLNIAGMPVWRDELGGIATPTSDNVRTKIDLGTTRLLCIVNGYDGNRNDTLACAQYIQDLLRRFADSDGGECIVIEN